MSGRRLILLIPVSMDGFAGRPDRTIDWPAPPAPADEQVTALRNVVKAPPQLVFRLYTEAEHLSAGGSTPPRDVIDKLDHISKAGAHLMGRTSYQEMSSYWPQSDDEYAAPMKDIPKVVFSKTLSDAEAIWPVTRFARGDLATEIATIKAEPGPDVIV
jgi:dihydrofolate reductase